MRTFKIEDNDSIVKTCTVEDKAAKIEWPVGFHKLTLDEDKCVFIYESTFEDIKLELKTDTVYNILDLMLCLNTEIRHMPPTRIYEGKPIATYGE